MEIDSFKLLQSPPDSSQPLHSQGLGHNRGHPHQLG